MDVDSGNTRNTRWLVIFAAAIIVGAMASGSVTLALNLNAASQRRHDIALSQQRQDLVLRNILCLGERSALTSKSITPNQRIETITFYTKALHILRAKPCRL